MIPKQQHIQISAKPSSWQQPQTLSSQGYARTSKIYEGLRDVHPDQIRQTRTLWTTTITYNARRSMVIVAIDLITELPKTKEPPTGVEYDNIMVVVETLTKWAYFIPSLRRQPRISPTSLWIMSSQAMVCQGYSTKPNWLHHSSDNQ